jgi:hypothetical protein
MHHVSIVGNSIRDATDGVRFEGSTFRQTPMCALNRYAGAGLPLDGTSNLPEDAVVVGGAMSGGSGLGLGTGRLLAGEGDPEGKVFGKVGDIFQRIDGTVLHTLYVKESGDGINTGWRRTVTEAAP